MRVKEESEKAGLKFSVQKMKIMAFGPITSWQIRQGNRDFTFLGSEITADSDYRHEIKNACSLEEKL